MRGLPVALGAALINAAHPPVYFASIASRRVITEIASIKTAMLYPFSAQGLR